MWSRAAGVPDAALVGFELARDLVAIRAAPTSYGTILLGSIRIPGVQDAKGEGFLHVR